MMPWSAAPLPPPVSAQPSSPKTPKPFNGFKEKKPKPTFRRPDYSKSVIAPDWNSNLELALDIGRQYNLPAAAMLGQMAGETLRGTRMVGKNNFFNIGAYDLNPRSAKNYESAERGIRAYGDLITTDPRYAAALNYRSNPAEFIRQISKAGYAGKEKTYRKRAKNNFETYADFVMSTPEYRLYADYAY